MELDLAHVGELSNTKKQRLAKTSIFWKSWASSRVICSAMYADLNSVSLWHLPIHSTHDSAFYPPSDGKMSINSQHTRDVRHSK